jgi:hypothetical protein
MATQQQLRWQSDYHLIEAALLRQDDMYQHDRRCWGRRRQEA